MVTTVPFFAFPLTAEVVILSPERNIFELVILPVIVPSAACFQLLRIGMPSFLGAAGLGLTTDFFLTTGLTLGAGGLGFGLFTAIGVALRNGGFGLLVLRFAFDPTLNMPNGFFAAGSSIVLGVAASSDFGFPPKFKNPNEFLVSGSGSGSGSGGGTGSVFFLLKNANGSGFFATGTGAGAGAGGGGIGIGLALLKNENGSGFFATGVGAGAGAG